MNKSTRTWLIVGGVALAALALVAVLVSGGSLTGAAGSDFSVGECVIDQTSDCSGMDLSGQNFTGLALRNFTVNDVDFRNSIHTAANWQGSSMKNTKWDGARLTNANFASVDLTGSDITQAQLDQVAKCSRAILPAGLTCNK